jgi:pSer/pThr/pTyr-binding forkhead associated (FHA) protein
MSRLSITSGPSQGQSFDCDRELVVGREGADLVIEDWEMSRRHAAIRPVPAGLEIEDLGSLNGTFVDGERITAITLVTAAATVKMGVTNFAVEVATSDAPLLETQRTVIKQAEPDQPVAEVSDRTTIRNVPDETPSAEPVAEVSDRTTIRNVPDETPSAEPIAEVSDRTTIRNVPDETPSAEPIAEVSDRTTVSELPSDKPIIDVVDRTVVRDVVPHALGKPADRPSPGADAPAGPPAAGPAGGGPAPGGGPPAGFPPGGLPAGLPPGGPPAPVRLLMKTPFGKRLMPFMLKMRQRRERPR